MASPSKYGSKQDTPFASNLDRQQRFIDFIADAHSLSAAAKLVGVHRDTVYDLRQRDSTFADKLEKAIKQRGDFWEDRLRELGDRPKPDTLAVIIGLKKEGRYVEPQFRHLLEVQVNPAWQMLEELRQLTAKRQELEAGSVDVPQTVEGRVRGILGPGADSGEDE